MKKGKGGILLFLQGRRNYGLVSQEGIGARAIDFARRGNC